MKSDNTNAAPKLKDKEHPVQSIDSMKDERVLENDWIEEHVRIYGKEPNLFDGA